MFNLTSKPSSIKVEVYDKETFKKDDFVGSGTMMVEENRLMKIPIYEDKKETGIVFVVIDSKVWVSNLPLGLILMYFNW